MPCEARNAETTAVIAVIRPSLLPLTKRLCRSADTIPICDRSSKTSQLSFPNTRTGGGPLAARHRPLEMRQQADQDGFPGAVGPDDGGVLARGDGEGHVVENGAIVLENGRLMEFEDGRGH